jgi:uncharacterized protein YigE (DUF2233 family)
LVQAGMGFVPVHVLSFSPAAVEMRLLFPPKGQSLSAVKDMPGCSEALACFNGPFFTTDDRPIGLLISGGRRIQKLKSTSWGVFYVDRDHRAHVAARSHYQRLVGSDGVEFAVQSGPGLLGGSKTASLSKGLALRTAVGIDRDGQVHVVVTRMPVSLSFLARFGAEDLHLVEMLNLDGGSSSQLVTHDGLARVDLPAAAVAAGIGLYPRATGASAPGAPASPEGTSP